MTKSELVDLLSSRKIALRSQVLALSPAEHEANSRTFRDADAAIVRELARRDAPVNLGETTLHLTADRLNFVEVDSVTGDPSHADDRPWVGMSRNFLYRYAGDAAKS